MDFGRRRRRRRRRGRGGVGGGHAATVGGDVREQSCQVVIVKHVLGKKRLMREYPPLRYM